MSETLHAEAPLANSPEARTPDGTLKDLAAPILGTNPETSGATKVEPKTEVKEEPKPDAEGKTTLTKKDELAPGAPEKYEPFTAPEGLSLNPDVITKAEGIFKELDLNQDQAQRLVDFYAQNATVDQKAAEKAYEDLRADWVAKTKADPEIGTKLTEVKRDVSKALDAALGVKGATAFKQALDDTGAGDHPDVIKAIWKLSPRWIEGAHVKGGGPAPVVGPNTKPKSAGAALWPNLPSANG